MDEYIVESIGADDKAIMIDTMMKNYGQDILQLVYSYVKNQTIAEDLTQDIFIKCYRNLHTYRKKAKLKTWLWSIAINHCKDYLKSWYNKNVVLSNEVLDSEFDEANQLESKVIQQDEDDRLVAHVMSLSVEFREVIYLFYFEEMPIKEIASVTGINSNTVKTRLRRAKQLLKEYGYLPKIFIIA